MNEVKTFNDILPNLQAKVNALPVLAHFAGAGATVPYASLRGCFAIRERGGVALAADVIYLEE